MANEGKHAMIGNSYRAWAKSYCMSDRRNRVRKLFAKNEAYQDAKLYSLEKACSTCAWLTDELWAVQWKVWIVW